MAASLAKKINTNTNLNSSLKDTHSDTEEHVRSVGKGNI